MNKYQFHGKSYGQRATIFRVVRLPVVLSGEINGKVTSGCLRSDSSVIQGKVSS